MTITARLAPMAAVPATRDRPVPLVQPWAANACQVTRTGSTDNNSPSVLPYTTPSQARAAARRHPCGRGPLGWWRDNWARLAPVTAAPARPQPQWVVAKLVRLVSLQAR